MASPHPPPPPRGQWPGLFIVFEGGDGSGKSVQAQALYRRLRRLGLKARLLAEPGSTPLGELLRTVLTAPGKLAGQHRTVEIGAASDKQGLVESLLLPLAPEAELLLFAASRAQLVAEVIQPSLARGEIVICDRYAPSTLAYQGYGRGLPKALVRRVNNLAARGVWPDLVCLLDVPVAVAAARRRRRAQGADRMESAGAAFHRRVRRGYLAMAAHDPEGWLVLSGQQPREEIARTVWGRVSELLLQRRPYLASLLKETARAARPRSSSRGVAAPAATKLDL